MYQIQITLTEEQFNTLVSYTDKLGFPCSRQLRTDKKIDFIIYFNSLIDFYEKLSENETNSALIYILLKGFEAENKDKQACITSQKNGK
jgi:hypothetical protein